ETPEPSEPETPELVELETPEPSEPETPELVELETPELSEPETPQILEPEKLKKELPKAGQKKTMEPYVGIVFMMISLILFFRNQIKIQN
ncbi:adhesin, partial [Bacillus cereus]|nr:adhesin [Bacillus cereus]